MRVWLVKTGEPLPIDDRDVRLFRMGLLATSFVEAGHDVTWWSATYNHQRKRFRDDRDRLVPLGDRLRLRLIHTRGYRKNVSLARVLDHKQLEWKFASQAAALEPPEVLISAMPIPGLCRAAAMYGKKRGVPVVLDIRDLWPDVFLGLVPRPLSGPAQVALAPIRRSARIACRRATAICGITPHYVEWGLRHARRAATAWDRAFPMGYTSRPPSREAIAEASGFWAEHGLRPDCGEFVACFLGWLGHQFEIEPILEAARLLESDRRPFRFVFCGAGDNLERYRRMTADLRSVLFPGFLNAAQLWTLMRLSAVGLAPYQSTGNFLVNIPNKPVEYMSAGLPILSSLKGSLAELLERESCGVTYPNGDVERLVAELRRLHDDAAWRRTLASNAERLFRERFVAEEVYAGMVRHMERIVAEHGGGPPDAGPSPPSVTPGGAGC